MSTAVPIWYPWTLTEIPSMAIETRRARDGKPAYRVRIATISPITGKRQNRTIGTYRTKREADRAERDALHQQERGTLVGPKRTTVAELLDGWLATKKSSISPNSHHDYETAIRRHIKPALGGIRADQLTPAHVQAQYTAWHAADMSARMIHRCHVVLSQALAEAVRFGALARNVCTDVTLPTVERREQHVWTPAEVGSFLRVAKGEALAPLWYLLAMEGMRRGEALGLRWSDVNWERGTVHISQTVAADKSNRGAAVIRPRTKTRASARTVKLTRETLAVLGEHRDRQRFQRQSAGDGWHDHDLIASTSTGTPINPNNVTRAYNRIVMLAGVPRIRVHDLRHTAATMMLRAGTPPKIVSERLGHASVGITMDLYSHVMPDMQDVAAEAMSKLLAAGEESA